MAASALVVAVGHTLNRLNTEFHSLIVRSADNTFLAPALLRLNGLVRDNLLLYGRDPGWLYSDMNGFGPFAAPFVWFKLYWAAWALLLAVAAVVTAM